MMKQIFTLMLMGLVLCCPAQLPNVFSGKIERVGNFPSSFVKPRNVDIWLPADYSKNEKYPVLYMHDGQMLYDSTTTWNHQEWCVDETVARLAEEGKIKNCIVVGIWNSDDGRFADYFPQKPFNRLPQQARDTLFKSGGNSFIEDGVQSDNYLNFLAYELKPYIDSVYSTDPARKSTFVAGSSMGGLVSMYAICEYPEIFGGAACLSTHWPGIFITENNPIPGEFVRYLHENLPSPQTHKIYFDFGTETLDALYEPYQMQVDSVMRQKGFSRANWKTLKFAGENHSERAWAKRLYIPLEFLLEKK